MLLIGDIHGCFDVYERILKTYQPSESIQLGDFGVGFPIRDPFERHNKGQLETNHITRTKGWHKFIRGNHDSPATCYGNPNFLGDFGELKSGKIFYVSGAFSIDWAFRHEGIDMWHNEQLNRQQWEECIELWTNSKAEIMLSHDCPYSVLPNMNPMVLEKTITGQAFDAMLDIRKPKIWIFAHHHIGAEFTVNGVNYTCLGSLTTTNLDYNNCTLKSTRY